MDYSVNRFDQNRCYQKHCYQNHRTGWRTHYSRMNLPAKVLGENTHLLPERGKALDLACGRGGNALCLAAHGLETCAWDNNDNLLQELSREAHILNLQVHTEARDCEQNPPQQTSFDVIVVSHFLYRPIMQAVANSLKPGGIMFYETFTSLRPTQMSGPTNPDYLLKSGELLTTFKSLDVLFYREEKLIGNLTAGVRGKAQIIVSKNAI